MNEKKNTFLILVKKIQTYIQVKVGELIRQIT